MPLAGIVSLVKRVANAEPAAAPDALRAAIVAMIAAGHGRAETRETLLPAMPLGTDAAAIRVAIFDATN